MSAEAQGRLPTDGTDAFVETETQNLEGPWPELVGISVGDAEQILRALRPDLIIQLVHQGDMVTMDFREDRVRIFYNDDNITSRPPKIG